MVLYRITHSAFFQEIERVYWYVTGSGNPLQIYGKWNQIADRFDFHKGQFPQYTIFVTDVNTALSVFNHLIPLTVTNRIILLQLLLRLLYGGPSMTFSTNIILIMNI